MYVELRAKFVMEGTRKDPQNALRNSNVDFVAHSLTLVPGNSLEHTAPSYSPMEQEAGEAGTQTQESGNFPHPIPMHKAPPWPQH